MTPAFPEDVDGLEGVVVSPNLSVPMRDGVRLAADLYRPAGVEGPLPVLVERTPYDRRGVNHADRTAADPRPRSKPQVAAAFARAGYAVLLQDCRGRYGSEGEFVKYVNEGPDGADTLAWVKDQQWCDGRIGTYGLSYGAHVQAALAGFETPGLKAMFLDSGGFSSAYHSGIRQGGAFELKQLTWAVKHARLSPATAADPARRAALEAEDIRQWVGLKPWRRGASPLRAAPEYEAFVLEQWRNECFSDFWRRPGLYAAGRYEAFPKAASVHLSSWYDPYALTAVENFLGLKGRPDAAPVRLILGPWTHGQRSVTHSGDVDFGPDATLDGQLAADYTTLRLAFFDRFLKGLPQDGPPPPAVSIFVMGGGSGRRTAQGRLDHGGRWRDEADWPLPGTKPTTFHLRAGGRLDLEPARTPLAAAWPHDPRQPVPTIGGATASGAPLMEAGAFDQRERQDVFAATVPGRALADREDVLVFQTDVLEEDVEITGQLVAKLWVSSSAVDTDVMIKLVDVHPPSEDYPDGYAMNLTHGVLRLRFRQGFESPVPLRPGEINAVEISTFPTSNLFVRGHRIRLEIASSNFPHFDINPGSGAPAGEWSGAVSALNKVHLGPDTPSQLVVPVIPRRSD